MPTPLGFQLNKNFVNRFKDRTAPFGFNGLGELVYYRTYARFKENGKRECWYETVERVVNGTFSMQKRWMLDNDLGWEENISQTLAQEMFRRIFDMKFLPPGRGLWCMGTSVTEERGLHAALNNCAFVSTTDVDIDFAEPFCFTMDASMLGVGVGFDTKGANKITIRCSKEEPQTFCIPDSREGWVESLRLLLNSYTSGRKVIFDYSTIRPAGVSIKGFGGVSSGPGPLKLLHECIERTLDRLDQKPLSVTAIADIMNLIGRCVVAGNVRRTAEIAFGDAESVEYIELKNYQVNPERAEFGWTSNNSVFAKLGMNYSEIASRVKLNGEPGFAWLDNMQNYGRMNGVIDKRDWRAGGGNPCLEQTLENYELCCLVETFPHHHTDIEDYKRTLESAYLYAKTVTLGRTHWPKSNRVMLRNRRIGTSMSGIAQFVASRGMETLRTWCETGYEHVQKCDEKYSELFAIPRSIKTTCIKPSGTVSLLAGATPGMHAPESRFYIRRVRINNTSELIEPLKKAGYPIEPDKRDELHTAVVSIPIDAGKGVRTVKQLSMWEQLSLAAFLQKYWADNQVSCTVTFDPDTEGDQLVNALDMFQYQLKGVSFLPRLDYGAYEQMPYEEIDEETFNHLSASIKHLNLRNLSYDEPTVANNIDIVSTDGVSLRTDMLPDSFCDASGCR